MKIIYLFALLLLAFTADDWQPFSLDKHVIVSLPVAPFDMTEDAGVPAGTHVFAAQNGADTYQLTGPLAIPPALKAQDARGRSLYYEGVIKGLVQEQGNILLSRKTFSTVAGEGVAVNYKSPATADSKEMIVFSRAFIVNRSTYILTYFRTDGDTVSVAGRHFFNSLKIKP